MASNADQSDCAGAPSLKLSTLKRLREVIRQRSGKNDARERGCSNTKVSTYLPIIQKLQCHQVQDIPP
ncbi:hypothetical protein MRX96_043223, partial [Rhipicephalus microplus]